MPNPLSNDCFKEQQSWLFPQPTLIPALVWPKTSKTSSTTCLRPTRRCIRWRRRSRPPASITSGKPTHWPLLLPTSSLKATTPPLRRLPQRPFSETTARSPARRFKSPAPTMRSRSTVANPNLPTNLPSAARNCAVIWNTHWCAIRHLTMVRLAPLAPRLVLNRGSRVTTSSRMPVRRLRVSRPVSSLRRLTALQPRSSKPTSSWLLLLHGPMAATRPWS